MNKRTLLFLAQGFDALAIPGGFEKAGFYEDAYDVSKISKKVYEI